MSRTRTPLAWLAGAVLLSGTATAGYLQQAGTATAAGIGTVSSASTSKADFALAVQPGSLTVQQGRSGTSTVTVSATSGWTGTVALAAGGLPSGVTAGFSPASVSLGAVSSASSSLTVAVGKTAAVGTYVITVTGTSGTGKSAVTRSTTLGLTVQKQAGALSVTAAPDPLTLAPGSSGSWSVTLSRSGSAVGASVTLGLAGALPSGATAAFAAPNPTTGTSSTLTVSTSGSTPEGTYPLTLTASAGDLSASTPLTLVVATASGKAFGIADPAVAVSALSPGAAAAPLDLRLSNPNSQPLQVTNLTVSVNQPAGASCGSGNFAVTQVPSGYPLVLPAGADRVPLSGLGLTVAQLPTLRMLNLSSDQSACKAVTVTLAYTGSAHS
ncbi:MAG: hypothetical protein ACXVGH_06300 [Mycobacteriales bacterium]